MIAIIFLNINFLKFLSYNSDNEGILLRNEQTNIYWKCALAFLLNKTVRILKQRAWCSKFCNLTDDNFVCAIVWNRMQASWMKLYKEYIRIQENGSFQKTAFVFKGIYVWLQEPKLLSLNNVSVHKCTCMLFENWFLIVNTKAIRFLPLLQIIFFKKHYYYLVWMWIKPWTECLFRNWAK